MFEERGTAFLQGHEVAGFVVWDALEPAAVQDADPFEGQRAQGRLVACAASSACLVEGFAQKERGMV